MRMATLRPMSVFSRGTENCLCSQLKMRRLGIIGLGFGFKHCGEQGDCWFLGKNRAVSNSALRPSKVGIL